MAEAGVIRGVRVALFERGEDRVMLLVELAKRVALHQAMRAEQLELLDQRAIALDQAAVAGQLQDDIMEFEVDRVEAAEVARGGSLVHLLDQHAKPVDLRIAHARRQQ